jgi:hypothetical protein
MGGLPARTLLAMGAAEPSDSASANGAPNYQWAPSSPGGLGKWLLD